MEDFSKDIAETENSSGNLNNEKENDTDTDDSQKTVDYVRDSNNNNKDNRVLAANDEEVSSPKGRMKIKHYGIIRQSPKAGPAYHHCCYREGDEVFHSKKELNNHHRMVHTKVKCPDCVKIFPTPDALQRHRYLHNEDHQFKCALCNKTCAFQSDLDLHMAKHSEEKIWYCSYDDCNRDFKQKSDLTAHEVVHKGEDFLCEFPGCSYKNKDPRLVKRHQRVHTKKKMVKCTECTEKFVFYMQMNRHRNKVH